MKIERSYIADEDSGKITWSKNGATGYSVVNKDWINRHGEAPGYRIYPSMETFQITPALSNIPTDSGSTAYLTVQSSSALGQSANWANHNLFALQHHDTEPKSAYSFNSYDPHNPAVNFDHFFDGESLDQEDIVLYVFAPRSALFGIAVSNVCWRYFNLGMHHIPNTADLPNTVTTTAMSSMAISPQNYFPSDVSRHTIQGVRLLFDKTSKVTDRKTFGTEHSTCFYNMKNAAPDLGTFIGEIEIPKFPWNPSGSLQTNPGG